MSSSAAPLPPRSPLFYGAYVRQNSITDEFSLAFTGADAKPHSPTASIPVRNPYEYPTVQVSTLKGRITIPPGGEVKIPRSDYISSPEITPVQPSGNPPPLSLDAKKV